MHVATEKETERHKKKKQRVRFWSKSNKYLITRFSGVIYMIRELGIGEVCGEKGGTLYRLHSIIYVELANRLKPRYGLDM